MKKRNIELIVSIILIFIAWALWYLISFRQYQLHMQKEYDTIYIDVRRNINSIRIENVPSHVYFRVDGDFIQEGELELRQ